VLYEAPPRLARTCADLCRCLGDRQAALVRELTKLHEEVVRGPLSELAARYGESPPRGEVTLVVGPDRGGQELPWPDLGEEIAVRLARGESPREIADALSAHGRRQVYQRALELKRTRSGE